MRSQETASTDSGGPGYSRWQRTGLLAALPLFALALLLPAPAGLPAEAQRAAAVCALMVVLWVTEAVPLAATALLPLALFPLLRVAPMREVAANYGDSTIFLFMGGFFMAVTMQRWGLHRRVALYVIGLLGTGPRRIVLGFMAATALLSMWISNTATAMMMLPIALAISAQHRALLSEAGGDSDQAGSDFDQCLMLAIAYAASIGGLGTLIGTPPNLVFAATFKKLFPEAPEISFARWLLVGLPLVLVYLPLCWLYLTRVAFRLGGAPLPEAGVTIRAEIAKLGRVSRPEALTLLYFTLLALGWIFRQDLVIGPVTLPGWSSLLGVERQVNDAAVAMMVAAALFLTPVEAHKGRFLLDWESAVQIPWGILILFGGGLALADGFTRTGLALWVASQLEALQQVPVLLMLTAVALMMNFLTEVISNTAVATIFMPILAATAVGMGVDPLALMMVGAISSSLAFMLPVATPPNAVIFCSGCVRLPTMARTGIALNLMGVVLVIVVLYTVAVPVFGIDPLVGK